MAFYALPYTVSFEDTMAYGTHHFLTNLRFQCAVREHVLFDRIFREHAEARAQFDSVLLLTRRGYTLNMAPVSLGQRVAIFLTFDEPGPASLRLCVRTVREDGEPVAAGFQEIVFAGHDGQLLPYPPSFGRFVAGNLDLQERLASPTYSETVYSGRGIDAVFPPELRALAREVCASNEAGIVGRPAAVPQAPRLGGGAVLMFPGQGSFSARLLRRLVADPACAAGDLIRAADVESRAVVGASFADLAVADDAGQVAMLAACPDLDQYGIFVTGLLLAAKAKAEGIVPVAAVGHSFGEIAALCVSGIIEAADGLRAVSERLRALRASGAKGGMLALQADRAGAEASLDAEARAAGCVVAVANHPFQTVVSGPVAELARLRDVLASKGVAATMLASRLPYHSPALSGAAFVMAHGLRDLNGRSPAIPVYSPILGDYYSGLTGPGADLATHLVTPVDWPAALSVLREAGAVEFVECGGAGALSKFVGRLAGDAARTVTGERLAEGVANAPARVMPQILPSKVSETATASTADQSHVGPVAIVSMGAVVPGAADTSAFWRNCMEGVGGIADLRDLDPTRGPDFGCVGTVPDKTYSFLFGVVQDDVFPPLPGDGRLRAERFLEGALRQAVGPGWAQRSGDRTVCLVGSTADGISEYDDAAFSEGAIQALSGLTLPPGLSREEVESALRATPWWRDGDAEGYGPYPMLRGLVDRVLGADVGLTLIDAACASSLYTIDLGMRMLAVGQCDVAYVGGVFGPGMSNTALFAQFGGLSKTGSRPFDASADGVVFGEGGAVVVLKRLADAIADGDRIHGVIRGVGLSSDGRSPSVNVPRVAGQALGVRNAYREGLGIETVQYVEAHATATPVGDATEFASLSESFASRKGTGPRVVLGSVKSLTGHLGWLAGVASVIKVCKALEARTMPPQHGFERPNAKIDLEASPFAIPKQPMAWPANIDGLPRRAAVSGFGFGGTNAHLVIESFDRDYHAGLPPSRPAPADDLVVVAAGAGFCDGTVTWSQTPGPRADRIPAEALLAPKGKRLMPDVAEQMDAAQFMLLAAAGEALEALGGMKSWHQRTGIVVGAVGKARRAVAANERIFADRMARTLRETLASRGAEAEIAARVAGGLKEALVGRSRASNPYTLVGLMPNVMTGRVANMHDLMGPNMVVDEGPRSLLAALRVAARLIGADSCDIVLAGAVNATAPWPGGNSPAGRTGPSQDGAAVLALATRAFAEANGLPVLASLTVGEPGDDTVAIVPAGAGDRPLRRLPIRAERPHEVPGIGDLVSAFRGAPATLSWEDEGAGSKDRMRPPADIGFHTLMPVPAPLPAASPGVTGAIAYATGDRVLALALHRALGGSGEPAIVAPYPADMDEDATRAHVAALGLDACETLVVLADLTEVPYGDLLAHDRSERLAELAFAACREGFPRLQARRLGVVSLALGGWSDGRQHPGSAIVAGLLKSLAREAPEARVRSLALEASSVEAAAQALRAELAAGQGVASDVELAITAAGRHALRLAPVAPVSLPAERERLGPDSVILATGGGRGVTAVMVEALLERHRCTAILLGRSALAELPPVVAAMDDAAFAAYESGYYRERLAAAPGTKMPDMRRGYAALQAARELAASLAAMRRHGRVEYVQVDITDPAAVAAALERTAPIHGGRVDLVLHGAGVQISKRLQARRLWEWRSTLGTKLGGLRNVHAALARHATGIPTEYHLVSSVAGAAGNDGQADYGAANCALNALSACLDGGPGGTRWTTLGWLAWDGVGMTRGSEYAALARARGTRAVREDEGKALFMALMDGEPRAADLTLLPSAESDAVFGHLRLAPPLAPNATIAPARRPGRSLPRTARCEWRLDPAEQRWLATHLVDGVPTLPGAFMLDYTVRAALAADPGRSHALVQRIEFRRFLKVPAGRPVFLRAAVEPDGEALYVRLTSDFTHANGMVLQKDVVHAEAWIRLGDAPFVPSPKSFPAKWEPTLTMDDPYVRDDSPVFLSGPYVSLSGISAGGHHRVARFRIPEAEIRDLPGDAVIPAIALDAMFRLFFMAPPGAVRPTFVPVRVHDVALACGVNDRVLAQAGRTLRLEGTDLVELPGGAYGEWGEAVDAEGRPVLTLRNGSGTRLDRGRR